MTQGLGWVWEPKLSLQSTCEASLNLVDFDCLYRHMVYVHLHMHVQYGSAAAVLTTSASHEASQCPQIFTSAGRGFLRFYCAWLILLYLVVVFLLCLRPSTVPGTVHMPAWHENATVATTIVSMQQHAAT